MKTLLTQWPKMLTSLPWVYIAQPRAWVEMFLWLKSRGRAGMFVYGLFNLGCGSIIVAFHNGRGLPLS